MQQLTPELRRQLHIDKTAGLLVASNLLTIVLAVIQQWPVADVMWVYWGQSVIIGLFNFRRILDLKQFSTKGFQINNRSVDPTPETKRKTAYFFLIHYGFFHFVYFIFLEVQHGAISSRAALGAFVCVLVFAWNHRFSYLENRDRDRNRSPNIGTIMFFPYARIVPMHLTIIFGGMLAAHSRLLLVLFLGLKTLADVAMHMVEHADARHGVAPMAGRIDR